MEGLKGNGEEGRRTILRTLVRHVSGDSMFELEECDASSSCAVSLSGPQLANHIAMEGGCVDRMGGGDPEHRNSMRARL